MIRDKLTVRITEAELVCDVRAVLQKVQQGSEVIIEREDHRPVAVISSPQRSGRPIIDILRQARHRNSTVTLMKTSARIRKKSLPVISNHGLRPLGISARLQRSRT